MSETHNTAEREAPRRGRPPRVEAVAQTRRRRNPGSLDRMQQFKLDIFAPEDLDLENYVYYWMNDEGSNIRRMNKLDDYDFVTTTELGDAITNDMTDSESDERIRILVGNKQDGSPLYAYLMKKPRDFWNEDYRAIVKAREDMMEGRVYEGISTEGDEARDPTRYVPKGTVQLGHAGERRKGPVPKNLK